MTGSGRPMPAGFRPWVHGITASVGQIANFPFGFSEKPCGAVDAVSTDSHSGVRKAVPKLNHIVYGNGRSPAAEIGQGA